MHKLSKLATSAAVSLLAISTLAFAPSALAAKAKIKAAKPAATSYINCDWYEGDNTPTPSVPDPLRYGYVDLEAGYWVFVVDPHYPVGTKFRINGTYPNSRYMSLQMYAGQKATLSALADYQIVPDAGSRSPYTGAASYDSSIPPGGHYTLYLIYGPQPANPAPNTVYIDGSQFVSPQLAVFQYRIYNPFAPSTVMNMGGSDPNTVLVPSVVQIDTTGKEIPLSNIAKPLECNSFNWFRNAERQGLSQLVDNIYANPLRPDPIPPRKIYVEPKFKLYQVTAATELANANNTYMYGVYSQTEADLVLIRARAPTFATQPGVTNPQLRHWSLCENSALWPISFETYSCVEDYQAVIDADGFFNVVMSVDVKKPANANHAHGFDWMTFGTTSWGSVIFRHQLPSPDFKQSAFAVQPGQDPATVMGDYFPVNTYCSKEIFDKYTASGSTPAQVFSACLAGK